MGEIRVAVAGVGNLCSSLVQGSFYYAQKERSLGLLHPNLAGFKVSDIKFVAAFDIVNTKVSKDLSNAIFSEPNQAPKITEIPILSVEVKKGIDPDNAFNNSLDKVGNANSNIADIIMELKNSKTDIFINLISGGSVKASKQYAEAALEAGCCCLNATPAPVASHKTLASKFSKKGLPLVGDDVLDQIGATVLHIGLLEFLHSRGVHVDESYQLDVGGGTESVNTLEKTRDTKRMIKTSAVASALPYEVPLVSGSTDFVDFLGNSRDSFFWVKGRYFGGAPFSLDVRLSSYDAPNACSILFDSIRALKIAKDENLKGVIEPICSYGFKVGERKNLAESYRRFRELTG